MKVLISAYACSPYLGSEHAVGWNLIRQLSKYHDLVVIAEEEKCADSIEHYKSTNNDVDQVNFIYLRKKRARKLRKFWPPSYYWFYKDWQRRALKIAQGLVESGEVDIVHHLTMVGFREPGFMFKLNIPFVIGPIGGFGYFPRKFSAILSLHGRVYFLLYNLFNFFHSNYHYRFNRAVKKAGFFGTIAASEYNRNFIDKHYGVKATHVIPEIGPPENLEITRKNKIKPNAAIKLIWVGNLTDGKALPLLLKALKSFKNGEFQLVVYGKGKQKVRWQKIVSNLGLDDVVSFGGSLPRVELMKAYEAADLCVLTSLRDLSSMVTVEALSHGLPILCLDHCGFGEIIDSSCGIKVDVITADQVICDLRSRLKDISEGKIDLKELSDGALKKAQELSWEKKAELIDKVYHAQIEDSSRT